MIFKSSSAPDCLLVREQQIAQTMIKENSVSTKEAYKEKIEAEVDLAQAKLAELKAQARSSTADARIEYDEQIDKLLQKVEATRDKLKELGESGEDSWEQLKDSIEHTWNSLNSTIRDAVARLKK